MKLEDATIEDLSEALGKKIAAEQIALNQSLYRDMNGEYANTEAEFVSDGVEGVEWYCNEQLVQSVWGFAEAEYKKLVQEIY